MQVINTKKLNVFTNLGLSVLAVTLAVLLYSNSFASESVVSNTELKDLRAFTEVYSKIRDEYVDVSDQHQIFENAIRGMLLDLDPHSSYLSKKEFARLNTLSLGQYNGIGVEISTADKRLEIVGMLSGSPAETAKIQPGDIILAIDGKPVKGRSLEVALEELRGDAGTSLHLKLLQHANGKTRNVSLIRAIIYVEAVSSKRLENNYLYLRIDSFQLNTATEVRDELERQLELSAIPGLILDLRDNPGGILHSGVGVADLFITEGLIVTTKTRDDGPGMRLSASSDQLLASTPIIILIDRGTASAAEIVAGALQDTNRATILGEKSFGKGSIQSVIPLSNGGALKLTTALYYTPEGRSIQATGIVPDVLARSLQNEDQADSGTGEKTPSIVSSNSKDSDPTLTEALNLLRVISRKDKTEGLIAY